MEVCDGRVEPSGQRGIRLLDIVSAMTNRGGESLANQRDPRANGYRPVSVHFVALAEFSRSALARTTG